MVRVLTIAVGAGLLFATAHLTITKTTGYQDAHAVLVLALAVGVLAGACVIGTAWSDGRWVLAILTAVALLSGELFGLAQTGDRIVAERERTQAPARSLVQTHDKAAARVETASAKLASLPAISPRLTAAIAQKEAADSATLSKSSEKGCATNCRALLEQQVNAAEVELSAARAELRSERAKAERELSDAQIALEAAPLPPSGTPLADRLGMEPAKLDMIVASLGALGANGLAACLIAFGAHRREETTAPVTVEQAAAEPKRKARGKQTAPVALLASPQRDPRQHTAEFSVKCLKPLSDASLPLARLHARYRSWCQESDRPRLAPADFARELGALFTEHGIPVELIEGGQLVARGVALAE